MSREKSSGINTLHWYPYILWRYPYLWWLQEVPPAGDR